MAEYTDAKDEHLTEARIDLAEMQRRMDGVEIQVADLATKVDESKGEILSAIKNGNGHTTMTLSDIPLKWLITVAAGLLAMLGGSVASVADLVNQTP